MKPVQPTPGVLLSNLGRFARLVPAPLLRFASRWMDLSPAAMRHLRARLLRETAELLAATTRRTGFRQSILISADGKVYVGSNGIFLSSEGTNRYFKLTDQRFGNEGDEMIAFLVAQGIEVATVMDVGANFGEVSLAFAKRFRSARIIAVEASSENIAVLRHNLSVQHFPTDNIEVLHLAVSDREGHVEITTGYGSENSIILDSRNQILPGTPALERVPTATLSDVFSRAGVESVDFMKIDVEGAEPLLLRSLEELAGKIRTLLIEFGSKNSVEVYLPFFELFHRHGYRAFTRGGVPLHTPAEGERHYRESRSRGSGEDYWFVLPAGQPQGGRAGMS